MNNELQYPIPDIISENPNSQIKENTTEISKNIPEEVLAILLKLNDSQRAEAQLYDMLLRVDHTLINNVDKKYPAIMVPAVNVTIILAVLLGHEHHAQPE